MSVLARRSKLLMWFDGVNISDDIAPYFLTATYTDNDDGVSDDLQVTLQDRDKIWMKSWLNEMVNAAAGDALKIRAKTTGTATMWRSSLTAVNLSLIPSHCPGRRTR